MSVRRVVERGTRNALRRRPVCDRVAIEARLRRMNRPLGRKLGRIEWVGSFNAYIHRSAELLIEGWTLDSDYPVSVPDWSSSSWYGADRADLSRLIAVERSLWAADRASHATARVTPSKRLPVYLNAIAPPALASVAAASLLHAASTASRTPEPRQRDFAQDKYWIHSDRHWDHTRAVVALPFLTEIGHGFAEGLFAAASLRRDHQVRTILIERPRLRFRGGRLHADDEPAVVWPDGSARWYWDGIAVPKRLVDNRDKLTAETIAQIRNQELRRVALERIGWQRFLESADATLAAQDDYGTLWATQISLDGERVQLVGVVNSTPEPDGTYRRYFLRVPPTTRTARAAVAWTFGFDKRSDYFVAAAS